MIICRAQGIWYVRRSLGEPLVLPSSCPDREERLAVAGKWRGGSFCWFAPIRRKFGEPILGKWVREEFDKIDFRGRGGRVMRVRDRIMSLRFDRVEELTDGLFEEIDEGLEADFELVLPEGVFRGRVWSSPCEQGLDWVAKKPDGAEYLGDFVEMAFGLSVRRELVVTAVDLEKVAEEYTVRNTMRTKTRRTSDVGIQVPEMWAA